MERISIRDAWLQGELQIDLSCDRKEEDNMFVRKMHDLLRRLEISSRSGRLHYVSLALTNQCRQEHPYTPDFPDGSCSHASEPTQIGTMDTVDCAPDLWAGSPADTVQYCQICFT